MEQKRKVSVFQERLQGHKDDAQDALEYYRNMAITTQSQYTKITSLLSKEKRTKSEENQLKRLQDSFSAFISADYMMSKNLPFWGESPQPATTYYQMKLVCDLFGIVDHSKKASNHTYICDELVAGPKNTDHTISFLNHFIATKLDGWVKNITFCLDNAKICKCKYLLAWADQVVNQGRFKSIRFFYLVVGHTKFEPDRLFSSIARTFYARDVFCIEMLQAIAVLYSSCHIFTSEQIFQWRSALGEKYTALTGINSLHDFITVKDSSAITLKVRDYCYKGSYEVATIKKSDFDSVALCRPISYESTAPKLTAQKLQQLTEQYDHYIKADITGYIRPTFLASAGIIDPPPALVVDKTKRSCPVFDGSGHVQPGKKRHYVEKFCPVAAKQRK